MSLPTIQRAAVRIEKWMAGAAEEPRGDVWNNPDVRGALFAMHGPSCAYCQQELPNNDRGDVEHFRPKSTYPWLKYEFANYFLSCSICNRGRKSTDFPLRPGARAATYEQRARLAQEQRLLLDPASDDVEVLVVVDFENPKCPMIALATADRVAAERAQATIAFFDFNSLGYRKPRIKAVNAALELLGKERTAMETEALRRSASRYRPYGAAIRRLIGAHAPRLLPSAEEELLWLVADLVSDMEGYLDDIDRAGAASERFADLYERRLEEICWSLAVLWRFPPAASADSVRKTIAAKGRLDVIQPYYDRLGPGGP